MIKWAGAFALGLLVGVVLTSALVISWPKPKWAGLIGMPDFSFQAISPEAVFVWGAVRRPNASYPNNHMTINCSKAEAMCRVGEIDQIGDDQIGRLDFVDYKVISWGPTWVQAVDEELCAKITMNIEINSQSVKFVSEPINASTPVCDHADTTISKWELGRPVFWDKLDPKDEHHNGRFAVH